MSTNIGSNTSLLFSQLIPTNAETMEDEKQRQQPTASRKKHTVESSSDEDSDVEKNFILLTERRGRGGGAEEEGEQHHEGEEEEELSGGDDDDDDEEESDSGEEEEVEEGSDAGEEESDGGEEEEGEEEKDGDSEASVSDDDDDEDPEEAGGSSEIQTREDMKTGELVEYCQWSHMNNPWSFPLHLCVTSQISCCIRTTEHIFKWMYLNSDDNKSWVTAEFSVFSPLRALQHVLWGHSEAAEQSWNQSLQRGRLRRRQEPKVLQEEETTEQEQVSFWRAGDCTGKAVWCIKFR